MLSAKSAIGQAAVDDGLIISAIWGREKPSYFVVPMKGTGEDYFTLWSEGGASCRRYTEAEARVLVQSGAWVGIRETSGSPVAGWGRAVIKFA